MQFFPQIYLPGDSCVHAFDARFKLVLLLVFSIAVFFITTWLGLLLAVCLIVCCVAAARIPFRQIATLSIPLFIILLIIWLCNAFVLDVSASYLQETASGMQSDNGGAGAKCEGMALIPYWLQAFLPPGFNGFFIETEHSLQKLEVMVLFGTWGFSPLGALAGAFYVVRILVMFAASFVVVLTTSSQVLLEGFTFLLGPLRVFRVPVDDVAIMLSLALRFIPLISEQAFSIKRAQIARGASFGQGGVFRRIKAWFPVLIPLFVALFRRVETVAMAMDARCYGCGKRTSLVQFGVSPAMCCVFAAGLVLFLGIAFGF